VVGHKVDGGGSLLWGVEAAQSCMFRSGRKDYGRRQVLGGRGGLLGL
jgi:hypothetical protein